MFSTIYIEDEVREHPRALEIHRRFADADIIPCGRYGEVFNRKTQNFRLQKKKPALILAKKYNQKINGFNGNRIRLEATPLLYV